MLYSGVGVSQNKKESANYFKKLADLGNSESMAYYGKMLFYGEGIQIDKNEAIKYLKKSIELNNNRGRLFYGEILLSTNDFEREAEKLFKIIIQRGNTIVMNENGIGNVNVNKRKAELDVYGNALARYGEMLYYGIKTKIDKNEAIELLKKSIELDNQLGKIIYAEILLENDDLKNKLKVAEYFKQLINKNNSDAMYNYGMMLLTGNGIPINIQEAVKYIKHAAELENPRAMLQYGKMLSEG